MLAYRLGDLITLKRGYDLPEREREDGQIPIISSAGTTGFHSIAKVKGPGVVTGRYGTLGEVYYIKEDFWPLNTSLYVQDFKNNDPVFINYLLKFLLKGLTGSAAAVPGVDRNVLHEMMVDLPDSKFWPFIGYVLKTYDDLIETNNNKIKNLEKMAQLIYREWFLNFNLPSGNKKMIPSNHPEFSEIPDGWKVEPIESILDLSVGGDWGEDKPTELCGKEVLAIRGADFSNILQGEFKKIPTRFIKENNFNSRSLVPMDIVIENSINGKTRPAGQPLLITNSLSSTLGRNLICSSFCRKIRLTNPALSPIVYLAIKEMRTKGLYESFQVVSASGIANFQMELFRKKFFVLIPDKSFIDSPNVMLISNILEQSHLLASMNSNLCRLRDILLPKLISGEVEIPECFDMKNETLISKASPESERTRI